MLQRPVNSLFQKTWWLDAVAPGSWDAIELRAEGGAEELTAWMPYVVRTDTRGLRVIDMPQLTMTLGPWVRPSITDSARRQTAEYMSILGRLADAIPEADFFRQRFHHSLPTLLPFAQRGYDLHLAYTYIIDDLSDEELTWQSMSRSRRKQIKQARKEVEIIETEDLDVFLRLNRLTFARQGLDPPYSDDYVKRLDDACQTHDSRRILLAIDDAGNEHGAEYVVFDDATVFFMMSGIDPQYRSSNAGSLLMWEVLRFAGKTSRAADFEGGTKSGIEPFIASFGPEQVPYVVAIKDSLRWRSASLARDLGRSAQSFPATAAARFRSLRNRSG